MVAEMPVEPPASALVTLNTVPSLLPVAEFVRLSNVPVVIEDVTSDIAVCVESVPHAQVWAKFVLSIEFVVVPEVSDERELAPAPAQPTQLDTVSTPFTLTLPLK